MTKRMQPGFAAQAALVSVQLARKNVRGAQHTFEGADGFLRVYLRDRCDREALRAQLGERYEFVNLSYKPYPCCRHIQPATEALIALLNEKQIATHEVEHVSAETYRIAAEHAGTGWDDFASAQLSFPFLMSIALLWDAWNRHNGNPSMFAPTPAVHQQAAAGAAPAMPAWTGSSSPAQSLAKKTAPPGLPIFAASLGRTLHPLSHHKKADRIHQV